VLSILNKLLYKISVKVGKYCQELGVMIVQNEALIQLMPATTEFVFVSASNNNFYLVKSQSCQ